ncbi:uncharacterized protein LACBIDRAFT_250573 [Laccaria bicolor S238N-H82]|uniref:Predicted protein n=1 Tax=Laccaria bicolor (strain S238N-H82 / ATCC MYA-4686) TaxID=486041 RepID=B0DCW4_LACBS|nr:uncharacterized protein LACBIDRAFT_250573 [Laccaria bicolor S238N-H82]EDR07509.1 predicted protein [Laccaria bicolor S238N-H82]|eukprot:XP_001881901.1 predicted protein [Laccaria bicolor S238N-H82]
MFQLSIIKDTLSVHPSNFGVPPDEALIAEINKKYANRVLHDLGLCVCLFDLVQAGEGKVRYGDGFLWYKVVFRMVVFRPFTSEVIIAKVKSSDEDGIRLTIGFFDDMHIPAAYLPQPSAFDPNERAHFWLPSPPSPPSSPSHTTSAPSLLDSLVSSRMYIDQGEILRVRVEADQFCDDEPGPQKFVEGVGAEAKGRVRAPYNVVCSIAEQGLGPVAWWTGETEDTGDVDAEGDAMEEG